MEIIGILAVVGMPVSSPAPKGAHAMTKPKPMPEILGCPECLSEDVHDYWLPKGGVAISCNVFSGCGKHTAYYKTLRGAINAWNRIRVKPERR